MADLSAALGQSGVGKKQVQTKPMIVKKRCSILPPVSIFEAAGAEELVYCAGGAIGIAARNNICSDGHAEQPRRQHIIGCAWRPCRVGRLSGHPTPSAGGTFKIETGFAQRTSRSDPVRVSAFRDRDGYSRFDCDGFCLRYVRLCATQRPRSGTERRKSGDASLRCKKRP